MDQTLHQTAIEQLQNQWQEEQKQYLVPNGDGTYRIPEHSSIGPIFGSFLILFAIALSRFAFSTFNLLTLVLGISAILLLYIGISSFRGNAEEAQAYLAAKKRFEEKMENLKKMNTD